MSDLVTSLRELVELESEHIITQDLLREAADRIEELEKKLAGHWHFAQNGKYIIVYVGPVVPLMPEDEDGFK